MGLGSWSADAERPFVTARKAFRSPWTGRDKSGEGCGERMKEKERERRGLLSFVGCQAWCASAARVFRPFFVPPCDVHSSERISMR